MTRHHHRQRLVATSIFRDRGVFAKLRGTFKYFYDKQGENRFRLEPRVDGKLLQDRFEKPNVM